MTAVYLGAFILGLVVGVAIMLFGIERPAKSAATSQRTIRSWLPLVGAFAAGFEIAGYSLSRVMSAGSTWLWVLPQSCSPDGSWPSPRQ